MINSNTEMSCFPLAIFLLSFFTIRLWSFGQDLISGLHLLRLTTNISITDQAMHLVLLSFFYMTRKTKLFYLFFLYTKFPIWCYWTIIFLWLCDVFWLLTLNWRLLPLLLTVVVCFREYNLYTLSVLCI